MQVSIKIEEDDYKLLQQIKMDTGIKSSPVIIKLALNSYTHSKDYAKLKLGLIKEKN